MICFSGAILPRIPYYFLSFKLILQFKFCACLIVCNEIKKGVTMILDLTWTGWGRCRQLSESTGIPYIRADVTIGGFVQVVDAYLTERKGTDAALIFQNEEGTYECTVMC